MKQTPERIERCLEPVSSALIRHLIVPQIYFTEPVVMDFKLDLLALDRAGTGASHGVRIYDSLATALKQGIEDMLKSPTHYRWIAYQGSGILPADAELEAELNLQQILFPAEGMGRLGVIEVIGMQNKDLGANIRIKAERFKVVPAYPEALSDFIKNQRPDIHFDD